MPRPDHIDICRMLRRAFISANQGNRRTYVFRVVDRRIVSGEELVKVIVDHDKCEGNARCVLAAPEVFELHDDDQAYVLIERPGANLAPKVAAAVQRCPRQAITIVDE